MSDPARIGAEDQLVALTGDLLKRLGLEEVSASSPEPDWIASMDAQTFLDYLLVNAANVASAGHLWTLVALRTPTGDLAAHFVEVRRRA